MKPLCSSQPSCPKTFSSAAYVFCALEHQTKDQVCIRLANLDMYFVEYNPLSLLKGACLVTRRWSRSLLRLVLMLSLAMIRT